MATAETLRFRILPELDLVSGNVSENFKTWKRKVEVYLAALGASKKDKKVQTAISLNCAAGPYILEVYDNFVWEKRMTETNQLKY